MDRPSARGTLGFDAMPTGTESAFLPGNTLAGTPLRTKSPLLLGRFTVFEVQLYNVADTLSGALLLFMIVFGPWAFGTTQWWSIWTMNIAGCFLGAGLMIKLVIRRLRGYSAPRWESERPHQQLPRKVMIATLACLTLALLAWCLVSAVNARATFSNETLSFEYHQPVRWLPHSFDRNATLFAFWMYLGLACMFWAARDWVLGKSAAEIVATGRAWPIGSLDHAAAPGSIQRQFSYEQAPLLPARLRWLLWVLAINGALLALESIVQRGFNSPELLFLVKPRLHQTAEGQFGPYAYRSNAAQYFNMLWPVCIGFWWTLNRNGGRRQRSHYLLLIAVALLASGPVISASRAGAIIAATQALAAGALLVFGHFVLDRGRRSRCETRTLRHIALCLVAAFALGLGLGWNSLRNRLPELNEGLAGREQLYDAARPIAKDYPLFGTGPGTFETVSQLYPRPKIFWPAQLHNDWLETRITFGWLGSALICLGLICVLAIWFNPGGIHGGRRFVMLVWVALAGCLLHARYDFPFQIYSTLLLFLLLCSILTVLSRKSQ